MGIGKAEMQPNPTTLLHHPKITLRTRASPHGWPRGDSRKTAFIVLGRGVHMVSTVSPSFGRESAQNSRRASLCNAEGEVFGVCRDGFEGREKDRRDLYQEITDKIIAELEAGRLPWVQHWGTSAVQAPMSMPKNAATQRRYSGINVLILWGAVVQHGFPGRSWLTFRQAQGMGGNVRKGGRGTTVVFADRFIPDQERAAHRFTVFNIAQCDGLPDDLAIVPPPVPEGLIMPEVEALIRASGADLRLGGNRAIADGFPVPYRVHRAVTATDAAPWRATKGGMDRYGRELPDEEYQIKNFQRVVVILAALEKLRIVAEVEEAGASFAAVRRGDLAQEPMPVFVPVRVTPGPPLALPSPGEAAAPVENTKPAPDHGRGTPMIVPPTSVRVWLANGHTDMRRGMNGLALQVPQALQRDPHAGDLYVFRGRRGDLLKILWHDGLGMSL
eukprot:gene1365-1382_t